jgi:hypothetical protein
MDACGVFDHSDVANLSRSHRSELSKFGGRMNTENVKASYANQYLYLNLNRWTAVPRHYHFFSRI